ncbi:hypothetical protein R6Q59_022390 [Mikania micrantha]
MLYNSTMNPLLNPIFLHACAASIQFLFLILILISWVWNRFKIDRTLVPKQSIGCLFYKQTLFCCLVLSLFNLVLCFLNSFYWYRNGWTDEKIVTLLHAVLGSLVWLVVSIYLHTIVVNLSTESRKYPTVIRVWWVFFFTVSCYSLVVDYVYYKRIHDSIPMLFVSDSVSSIMGLFLCFVGLSHKTEEVSQNHNLEQPLLNSSVSRGDAESTYENASFFSLLTFSWMSSVIAKGNKKALDLEDVPQLASIDSVRRVYPVLLNKVESLSNGENQITSFALTKALLYIVWKEVVITGLLALVSSLCSFVGPYLIEEFVQYLNGQRDYKNQGFVLVAAFLVSKIIACFTQRHWYFKLQQAGIRAWTAIVAMIYQKGLTISGQSKQGNSSGEIINFMAVDAQRIGDYAWYMHDFWLVFVQVGVALWLLYKNLGLAFIASLIATIIVLLANLPLGHIQEKLQDDLMKSKDKRMKSTSEILRNMRILKLQGWEMKFLSKIIKLRDEEEGALKKYMYTLSMTSFIFWGAPIVVAVATFATCLFVGIPLESGKVLSALATFKILQEPIYNLPDSISVFFQTKVSLGRIATYLRLNDIDPCAVNKVTRGSSEVAVEIINGNFSWDSNASSNHTLKDINVRVNHGMRVAICGTVGSGKSSLLSCILGEVAKISGSVKVEGSKAYVAQSPWIQSGKIEDNILFGREMDRERYEKVLEACSLKKDLEILSFGDQTVIGERGINLSGGQKQRIQIARALYQDADVYLFDDPFSAVDAHTGSHIFNECMLKFLDSKTVIYITHQVEFLPAADLILVLRDGRITQAGKYNDILNSGSDFMDLVSAHKEALSAIDAIGTTDQEQTDASKKNTINGQNGKPDDSSVSKAQLVQEEEREKGRVGFSVYWKYITTAYGGALAPLILLVVILFQTLQIGSNYWMAWASPVSANDPAPVSGSTLIIVYVALAAGCAICVLARGLLIATTAYKAATILFHQMHLAIFRSPMSFFDSTPSGRILNRASTDQSAVDLQIPYQVASFVFAIIQLLGIIVVMSQCAWQVIIIFIPVAGMCIWLQQYYLPSAREMARLVGVCKGPVIQNFAETISGSVTIRSFDQQARFQDTNLKLNDDFARPKFHAAAAMEWLGIRLDMLSSFTFAVFLIFLISIPEGTIDPSIAGLAATYGLTLNTLQGWVVWTLTNLENKIISVERIFQYSSIPSEPPLVIESNRPNDQWPSQGEVDIHHLQVRYAPHMPLVLRGLTCTFNGGKKTGIVGRTGSGKSTLIQTLFRLVEPSAGQILIDGINISTIGLHDLRSRLSIIPQDPTMFEGTIRSNLDPLEEYTDDQIWEALDKCQLGDEVRSKEGKLDSPVTENGENWSVGQRQLVCLGRVLLKKTKVLVLDEATASVDTATDGMIQQTLGKHFTDSTVIMIAHRITSVLDSDMVLVLEQGLIDEYDSPTKLLEDKSSSFAKLVADQRSNHPLNSSSPAYNHYRSHHLQPKEEPNPVRESAHTQLLVKSRYLTSHHSAIPSSTLLKSFVGPYLIEEFVQYLNGQKDYKNQGFVLVAAFLVSNIVGCFTRRHWFFKLQQAGIRAWTAIVAMIYQKGLIISGQSKKGNSSGEIINYIAVDAQRIGDYAWYMHDFWLVLVQVGVALWLLYKNLGLAVIASLIATIIVLLANLPLGNIQEKLQDDLMKSKDKRMKSTSEILRNMRILKLQGWEMKFLSKIIKLRDEEEGALKKYTYTLSMTSFIFWGAPIVVAVATFATCLFVGIPLESGKVISALATFKILQEPIYNLPDLISVFFQTKVSLGRIATYLRLNDIDPCAVNKVTHGSSEVAVEIINGNFSWDSNASSNQTLKDVNVRVNHGMRVAVCGIIGSGKSSLLSCILGEVSKISGSVKVEGSKAYVAQSPWIQSGKIEDNILFGREMDRERYEKVLEACALNKDLEILSFGDQTVIGERGINLSGGQKQRIQIARALYQDADIYLFDDPFSAVDAHTGSHLFNECMLNFLDSKTVIYITHQVEFLHAADLIFVLRDGRITQAGKYDDILNYGGDFMDLVSAHKEALSAIDAMGAVDQEQRGTSKKYTNNGQNGKPYDSPGSKAQLVQEEEREKGRVGFSVYWKYITMTYGGALALLILLAVILFQILQIGSNYWMAWASPASANDPAPVTRSTLIIVYVALAAGCAICVLARGLFIATIAYKTATILFHRMHLAIFRSPMSFFDSTPSGRILNRASTDQSEVDLQIPYQVASFVFAIIQLFGIIAVMSQCAWQVIIIFIPVAGMCIWLQQYYLPSAREMARLVGVCKGPVIQNFAETISGSLTIRSFDQQARFQDLNLKLNDDFARPKFHAAAAIEWLKIRLDMLSSFTFAVFLIFLISIPKGSIDPSIAGLAVTYGFTLNTLQGLVVWTLTNLENKIISVERIFQYSSIPSEPPLVIESNRPNDQWPSQGEVDIHRLQVRYAPHMPLVLRGLMCTFNGGKKTGIVGRTGSGKSTLIQTLFRLVEPTAGQILIDGINIATIGLHDLRSRLSIIPQDPTMFEGTIRSNLDPLEEYTDDQIWEALDKCQLGDEVRSKVEKLDSPVIENGENWSVGQRQLVCLGRVLLKKTKVLVLDEATASVDTATDGMIQQTLGKHFTDSTVIMIAHRITSVLDSDMVLVLEQGLIDEYDSPTKLLEDNSSSFAKLVAEYSMRSSSSYENLAAI